MISVNTMGWAAGKVGAESISAHVSFLAAMDWADMESAPTLVNMVWHNDKFMQLNIVDVLIVFCNFDLPLFPIAARSKLGCGKARLRLCAIIKNFPNKPGQ